MRKASLVFILAVVVIDMLGIGLVYPLVPRLIEGFLGGDMAQTSYVYGFLVAIYAAMQFIFAPVLGSLSDRYGRRPVILIALVGLAVDYLVLAFAPNLWWFIPARIISGICGATFTTAGAYMADVTPPEKRAQNFGLIGAAFGFGFIIGPAIGGFLGDMDVRLPFLVAAGLTFVNMLFGIFVLPESLKPENRRKFSLKQANPVGALIAITRHHHAIITLLMIVALASLAVAVGQVTWVLYTTYRYGWGPFETGLSLMAVGVVFIVGQGVMTRVVVKRLGERRTAFLGLTVAPIAYVLYGLAYEGWMIYVIMLLGLIGWTVAGPAVQAMISRAVPANEQGLLQGAMGSINSLAGIVGPPLWNGLFGYFVSPAAPFILPGAAFFGAAIVMLMALALALKKLGPELEAKRPKAPETPVPALETETVPVPPEVV